MISRDLIQAETINDIKNISPATGTKVFLAGRLAIGDSAGGFYYWDKDSNLEEDTPYFNIIKSDVINVGRWRRIFSKANTYPHGTLTNNAGIKRFFTSGITNANGEVIINITEDGTVNGIAIFQEIWIINQELINTNTNLSNIILGNRKSVSSNLKQVIYLYSDKSSKKASPGIEIRFEVVGK